MWVRGGRCSLEYLLEKIPSNYAPCALVNDGVKCFDRLGIYSSRRAFGAKSDRMCAKYILGEGVITPCVLVRKSQTH
jgi:hypothetical protein